MALGTFKWFDVEGGYGLISPDDGGRNLFTRNMSTAGEGLKSLAKGDKVAYEVHQGRKGPRAVNVSKEPLRYSWRDDCLDRLEGKEARHEYYARLG
jgi:cold shock protein